LESVRGRLANFSLLQRSFIVNVSGNSEMKSRAVSLSINVAVIALPFTVSRITVLTFREECVVTWCPALGDWVARQGAANPGGFDRWNKAHNSTAAS
jgi:hypothetical protein